MEAQNQIIYFPYLNFKQSPITFGNLVLWSFDSEKKARIPDDALRLYIEKLLEANVNNGIPIKNMAVVSTKDRLFVPVLGYRKEIAELRDVLFLCGVAKNNIHYGQNVGLRMLTAENFTIVFQNFKLGSEWTSYSSGSIVEINAGGYKVGEIKYEKPPYVLMNSFDIDVELFRKLVSLRRRNAKAYRRILMAVDAFISGYYNSPDLSRTARILEQARTFEILLNLQQSNQQRKYFKSKIATYCPLDKYSKQRVYSFLSARPGGKKDREKGTMQVIWADRFYTLRNHIIHGEKINNYNLKFKKQRHQDIAILFFILLVKKFINEVLKKEIFCDKVLWKDGFFKYKEGNTYKLLIKHLKRFF